MIEKYRKLWKVGIIEYPNSVSILKISNKKFYLSFEDFELTEDGELKFAERFWRKAKYQEVKKEDCLEWLKNHEV